MQLFSALEGSHRDNPLKDLSVGRDTGQGLISGTFPGRSGRLATMEVYLLGREFTICTDHQALKHLQRMKNSNSRLTRWALAIQPFLFDIVHKPGLDNTNADGLSHQDWDEDIYIAPEGVGTERDNFSPEEGEGSVGREPSSN